jgi:glutamate-1-semialdehyde 2,1-aminomutase
MVTHLDLSDRRVARYGELLVRMVDDFETHAPSEFVERYRRATVKSAAHWRLARSLMPQGTSSNLRAWAPYPMYFGRAAGSHVTDLDGNRYIDCAMAQGVLAAGHLHPAVIEAVEAQLRRGTVYGGSHRDEATACELLLERYPCHERVRMVNSGSEAVLHAVRLARAATGRSIILKVEGTYHGNYDPTMVSFRPTLEEAGPVERPSAVPFTAGLAANALADTVVIPFNDAGALAAILDERREQVAAVLVEPVILNMGCTLPHADYFPAVRELCDDNGVLLIFDEAKTGTKIAWGGGPEFTGVQPDVTCVAKAIGGGFPVGAILANESTMRLIDQAVVLQTGSFAGNPVSVAATIVTLRDVLTREAHRQTSAVNLALAEAYERVIADTGLAAHVVTAGVTGALFLTDAPVTNYRDDLAIDPAAWDTYWLGMLLEGVIPQAYGLDDSWTISVAHDEGDVRAVGDAFAKVAPVIAEVIDRRAADVSLR